ENDEGENPLEAIDDENLLPSAILERKEITTMLTSALEKISPTNQTLLTLRYLEDFSLEEIAEILGEPYNTIKSRHLRALKRLKQEIIESDASDGRMIS
ncbi:MAG: sigma-70 family RNA polymerase sigma factor, partial [Candidatus Moraniibacteriota bacterium]